MMTSSEKTLLPVAAFQRTRWEPGALARRPTFPCRGRCPAYGTALCEDCGQETYLFLRHLEKRGLPPLSVLAREKYLLVCLRRFQARYLHREWQRQSVLLPLDALETLAPEPAWDAGAFAGSLLDQISREEVAAALRTIPPRDCALLERYYRDESSDREIAALLATSPAAVKKRRQRTLDKLRLLLVGSEAA